MELMEKSAEQIRWDEFKRMRRRLQELAQRKKQERKNRWKSRGFKLLGVILIALSLWFTFGGMLTEPNGKIDGGYLLLIIPLGLVMIFADNSALWKK